MGDDGRAGTREGEADEITPRRRLVDAAVDIMGAPCERPEFLHSLLCQVGLPRASTTARTFERKSGTAGVRVEAGTLWRGGDFVPAPLPYGTKPRLILVHLCGEAVRTRCADVEVGTTLKAFLCRLGMSTSGAGYARFRS